MIEKEFYDKDIAWCPGCGDFPILRTLNQAIDAVGLDRRKLVLVSGIGQAAKLPHYTTANVFNGLHGRALPAAAAIKLTNHELEVVVTSGDGDVYGEGGNHLLHNLRRNVGIKVLVHNNQVYGLTKGQASPTSDVGYVTPAQTNGVISLPFNPLALAVAENCSFAARTFAGDPAHMQPIMEAALRHRGGMALVDILQPCVTFNKVNTYQWYRERVRPVADDYDPSDRAKAFETALKWGDEIPVGIIYRSDRPTFESQLRVLQRGTLVSQYGSMGEAAGQ